MTRPASRINYELHPAVLLEPQPAESSGLPWTIGEGSRRPEPLAIGASDGLVWAQIDEESGALEKVGGPESARIGLQVVARQLTEDLVMLRNHGEILVNGMPALKLSALRPKDAVLLAPGRLFYVTQRVQPHAGAPTADMLGTACPFCTVRIKAGTVVATCVCGAIYHIESEESHPQVPPKKRLSCIQKVKTCIDCHRELTLESRLIWDPEVL